MVFKKKIILSYDYELFFGDRSGTVLKSLIEPTNLLLDAMDSVGFKGNFFVDWQMLKYLKEANTEQTDMDYVLIVDQLKDIIRRGHRIELHIHPHWVDAKYNGDGTWNFSEYRHYSLNSFSEDEIIKMFVDGIELLTGIAREVDPIYKIVAFRAGGWAVQPFSNLRKAFIKSGIKIDSSVAYGACETNQYSYFDFRDIKADSAFMYRFSSDVTKEDVNGEFLEIPITSFKRGIFYRVLDKLFRLLFSSSKVIADGTHYRSDLKATSRSIRSMVTLSRISPVSALLSILIQNTPIVTVIDHPKDYTPSASFSIKLVSKFYSSIIYKDLINEEK